MEMQRGGVLTPLDPLLSGSLRRGSRLAERRTAERLQATLRTQQGRRRVVRDPEMVQALAVLRGRVRELRAAPSPVQAGSISFGASSQWGDTVDSRGMRVSMGRSSTAMGFRSSLGNSIDQFDERLSSRVSVGVTKDNLEVRLPTPLWLARVQPRRRNEPHAQCHCPLAESDQRYREALHAVGPSGVRGAGPLQTLDLGRPRW